MRDLINRQEQCDKVCRVLDDVLANRPTERDSLIIATRKAFEALEGAKWIPCSERMPEAGKYVLRTIRKFGWHGEEYWSVDIGPYNTNDGSIIAWMPLPEPYREERTEE